MLREYTAPSCRGAPKAFHAQYQPLPLQVPIYTPGWREAIIVKYLAQGHKYHDQDSNPHSVDLAPELEFDGLNHSAVTPCHPYRSFTIVSKWKPCQHRTTLHLKTNNTKCLILTTALDTCNISSKRESSCLCLPLVSTMMISNPSFLNLSTPSAAKTTGSTSV